MQLVEKCVAIESQAAWVPPFCLSECLSTQTPACVSVWVPACVSVPAEGKRDGQWGQGCRDGIALVVRVSAPLGACTPFPHAWQYAHLPGWLSRCLHAVPVDGKRNARPHAALDNLLAVDTHTRTAQQPVAPLSQMLPSLSLGGPRGPCLSRRGRGRAKSATPNSRPQRPSLERF